MVEMRQTSHETFTTVCSFIMTFSKLAATVFETEKNEFWEQFLAATRKLKRGLLPHGVNNYHVISSYSGQLFTIRIPCRISIRCKSAHKIGHKP